MDVKNYKHKVAIQDVLHSFENFNKYINRNC